MEEVWSMELCGGQLCCFRLEADRMIRVWTPPGFVRGEVMRSLWLNDGQNLFRDEDAFGGASWGAAGTVASLISSGAIPPMVVVGIDHAGKLRTLDYLPVPPTGWDAPWGQGMRGDMWDAPGGGLDDYLRRLHDDLLPWALERFGLSTRAEDRFFGGSSFGGICALYLAMQYPAAWGGVFVESPSFWAGEGRFMADVAAHSKAWPQRMYVAMGELEYTGFRGTERPGSLECDAFLRDACLECAEHLKNQGLSSDRLVSFVEPGGRHNERDWSRRLPCALRWLLRPTAAPESRPTYWSRPSPIVAGRAFEIYVEKAKLRLSPTHTMKIHLGFDGWSHGVQTCDLMPACLSATEGGSEWLAALICAPTGVSSINFAFTNGQDWDNNHEKNYDLPVGPSD